jgi:hypothetical protein
MGLFSDVGYELLARERRKRFEEEGREGESLGFYNRPDLNNPWGEESAPMNWPVSIALFVLVVGGSLGFGYLVAVLGG